MESDVIDLRIPEKKEMELRMMREGNNSPSQSKATSEGVRLEDIPQDILRKYGIVMDNGGVESECEKESEYESEGELVIDEGSDEGIVDVIDQVPQRYPRLFFCTVKHCQLSFETFLEKVEHQRLHCATCMELFRDIRSRAEHANRHCGFHGCLDVLADNCDLVKHRKIHQHPQKPFQCLICRRRFKFWRNAHQHVPYCKVANRSFSCAYCKMNFSKPSILEKHISKHDNSINCEDCDKNYISLKLYKKHLTKAHRKRLVFYCKDCPKTFLYQESLVRHLKGHNIAVTNLTGFVRAEEVKDKK